MAHAPSNTALALLLLAAGCYSGDTAQAADDGDGSGSSGGEGGGSEGGSSGGVEDAPEVVGEPLHRLNRLEYNNTIRDLLGVTLTPADSFPPDNATQGFDNLAEGLTLTPSQMDLYALAAREVSDAALTIVPRLAVHVGARAHAEATLQAGTAFDWGWSMPRGGGGALAFTVDAAHDETVTVSILAGGDAFMVATPEMGLVIDGVEVGHWLITSLPTAPTVYSVQVPLAAGSHGVAITFPNGYDQPAENVFNSLVVGYLDVRSEALHEPPGRALVYLCDPVQAQVPDECYRRIVTSFAARAWRRPVTQSESDSVFALWQQLAAAEGPEVAVKLTVRAMLLSAKFLYRPSAVGQPGPDTPPGLVPLDDYALASRLSYFVWSTMPDEELFDAAGAGLLREEDGLREQVRRMLVDPKADALRRGFASQWLSTRHLPLHAPDPATFPSYDAALRDAMIAEAELFFADFLTNKRPIGEMMRPDFGFLNDRLALHYGMPAPGTDVPRKVTLGGDDRRGLMMQGAWLTAMSASNRTSPVLRGRWILEQTLCLAMPPPPPDIPPLMPPPEGATIREVLAEHRKNAACAGCHDLIDPAGLGMEGFDGIGARRDLENGAPVDESGGLPPNLPFVGAAELAELLADDPRFSECLTEKLFTYALGRGRVGHDVPYRMEISEELAQLGGSLDQLIELIALSPAFRMRTAGGE